MWGRRGPGWSGEVEKNVLKALRGQGRPNKDIFRTCKDFVWKKRKMVTKRLQLRPISEIPIGIALSR